MDKSTTPYSEHDWITGRCDHVDEDQSTERPTNSDGTTLSYLDGNGIEMEALKEVTVLDKRRL